ncbi:MAG: hypothetical protein M1830_003913 [Pleopsidium flavum]|nr:MAG: hypothetical protein M1830_003913 [Pleopsidium flavum]
MSIAKLIERKTHAIPGKLKVSELFFDVPKDYSKPGDGSLRIFARSVERVEKPADGGKEEKKHLPWFVYLQGGPGMSCSPPQEYPWINPVLEKGYQMLFLDQRGTGLSSAIFAETLARHGKPQEQADYLKHFRADNIVRDCEAIRKVLTEEYPEEKKKWTVMGQSFGGFCTINYLSRFPEGLQEAFVCGGLAPLVKGPDEVYKRTYSKYTLPNQKNKSMLIVAGKLAQRNVAYYRKSPEDVKRVKDIVKHLHEEPVTLPSRGTLSVSRFRGLGLLFGSHGGLDMVHDVVLRACNDLDLWGFFIRPTLSIIERFLDFDDTVLYAVLHESCYLQGRASRWSADRIMQSLPRFRLNHSGEDDDESRAIYFTGEMIYKDMFEDYVELRKLRETAHLIAEVDDWPDLYDEEQLAKNEVPLYAITYIDDMYVDYEFAQETAAKIKNCKQFITNNIYHDGIRSKPEEVTKQLFALRDDVID